MQYTMKFAVQNMYAQLYITLLLRVDRVDIYSNSKKDAHNFQNWSIVKHIVNAFYS